MLNPVVGNKIIYHHQLKSNVEIYFRVRKITTTTKSSTTTTEPKSGGCEDTGQAGERQSKAKLIKVIKKFN